MAGLAPHSHMLGHPLQFNLGLYFWACQALSVFLRPGDYANCRVQPYSETPKEHAFAAFLEEGMDIGHPKPPSRSSRWKQRTDTWNCHVKMRSNSTQFVCARYYQIKRRLLFVCTFQSRYALN
jgi:hypothetical protein